MQKIIKTVSSIVILSVALTSTSSAFTGAIVKAGQECIKRGCIQKGVKVIKELVGKGANGVKKHPIESTFSAYGITTNTASAIDYFNDEEEITIINNESNRTLDLLKMEK